MKKLITGAAMLGMLAIGFSAFAQTAPTETSLPPAQYCNVRHNFTIGGVNCVANQNLDLTQSSNALCCGVDLIYTITDWIFFILIALAVIFILIGAFQFITAGGSPEKASTGRNFLIYAVIGILVALIAKAIPYIARSIIGLS